MFFQHIAMGAPSAAEGAQTLGGGALQFVPLVFIVAIFYFIMIRPQQRRAKERKAMIAAVKSGNRVLMTSGILGEVTTVKEKTLIIRIAEQTKVEVLKSAVSQVIEKDDIPEEATA